MRRDGLLANGNGTIAALEIRLRARTIFREKAHQIVGNRNKEARRKAPAPGILQMISTKRAANPCETGRALANSGFSRADRIVATHKR
jgi:hypothetical protein